MHYCCCGNYLDYKVVDYISTTKNGQHAVDKEVLDFLPEKVIIAASSNGILLCRNIFKEKVRDHCLDRWNGKTDPVVKEIVLYVCNPVSKEWTVVEAKGKYVNGCCYGFYCDPFGSSNPNYEVVMVYRRLHRWHPNLSFEIYSSRTGTWRRLKDVCPSSGRIYMREGRFSDGVFYWLMTGHSILTSDMEQERPGIMKLPGHARKTREAKGMCLGVSEGKLHYICFSMDGLKVWVRENDASNWDLKYSKAHREMNHPIMERWTIGELHPNDGHMYPNIIMHPYAFEDDVLFLQVYSTMCTYNIKTEEFRELCSFSELDNLVRHTPHVIPYCNSLLRVQAASSS